LTCKRYSPVLEDSAGIVRAIVEALKHRFQDARGPELSDIGYATQNRQNAARTLAAKVQVIRSVRATIPIPHGCGK
jgi:4-hydroxy-3-methylbut-2-enyl diphosphate reductase IspH